MDVVEQLKERSVKRENTVTQNASLTKRFNVAVHLSSN